MLSQTQIIRSLGEALAWLEKELDWGAPLAELRHLTGRIGELYAAMLTRGQMAGAVNQRGYDVVGFDGERISVKTVTSSVRADVQPTHARAGRSHHRAADQRGWRQRRSDRNPARRGPRRLRPTSAAPLQRRGRLPGSTTAHPARNIDDQAVTAEGQHDRWIVRQYESGTVRVLEDGAVLATAMPALRMLAAVLGVDLRNANGGFRNTRQLGDAVLAAMKSKR